MTKLPTFIPVITVALAVAGPALAFAAEPRMTNVVHVAPKSYHQNRDVTGQVASERDDKSAADLAAEGAQRVEQNRMDEALSLFNKALVLDPANVAALTGRGEVFLSRDNLNAARADFDLALKSGSAQLAAWNGIGTVNVKQERPQEAVMAYTRVLERYPTNVYALVWRTRAYLKLRELAKAREDAEAARQIEGDTPEIVSLLVTVAMFEHRRDEAKQILQKVINANPDDVGMRAMMATILGRCEFLDAKACEASKAEAVAVYDTIIAAAPRAWTYAKRAETRPKADRDER